jgi:hypothetical protein
MQTFWSENLKGGDHLGGLWVEKWVLVNTAMKLWVPYNMEEFLQYLGDSAPQGLQLAICPRSYLKYLKTV